MKNECPKFKNPFSPGFWLKAWVLVLLGRGELHGYEIMNTFEQLFPEMCPCGDPSQMGRGYKILRILETEGYIQSRWATESGPAKRVYSLTPEGKKIREEVIKSIENNFESVKAFIEFARGKGNRDGKV